MTVEESLRGGPESLNDGLESLNIGPNRLPALLSLRGISRSFSGTEALRSIELDIHAGEFVAIVGLSGSGKSTLLNILGLLDTATNGTYQLRGADTAGFTEGQRAESRARTFGFVFQDSHVVGRDSTARNAALGLRARGIQPALQKSLVWPQLQRFGLSHRVGTPAAMLSGGERQRLAIARAVVGAPDVILADEPTGSLDTANGAIVLQHLRELHDGGTTVVMVTHDPGIAASADRIITMRDGQVISDTGAAIHRAVSVEAAEPPPVPALKRQRKSEFTDLVAEALAALTGRPGKALLLILAFLIGSGGLVAAIGLSESAAVKVADRIDDAASDEVRANRDGGYPSWDAVRSDLKRAEQLKGVQGGGIVADLSASVVLPSTFRPGTFSDQPVFGGAVRVADSGYLAVQGAKVSFGDPALLDQSFGGPVAFVGRGAAQDLGIGTPGPGAVVWLFGQPVPVVGLITDPGRDPILAEAVVVGVGSYSVTDRMAASLVLRTDPGMPAAVAEALPKALNPVQTGTIKVQTVADLRELKQGIDSDLGRLVAVVSVVLLAIACLSAGTTMYLGVTARFNEIALRRALGMRRWPLGCMFLLEGAIVGAVGGAAGGSIGMGAVLAYAAGEGWVPAIPWFAALWGICAGTLSGTIAAAYPAIVASKADPAQLIRG
ncbi:ATP-binding cassette domain-containing protein [Paenarthrobacter sp. NPDC089316]|uniref:ABC transporter ATP-binding protein/permease n=1 Tax=unclassified Paenarthrobacter TaxID=2634190 RepID=UPI00343E2778